MDAVLFEDIGKVDQGWNLFISTLLILVSVPILYNKISFNQVQMRGMTSCSALIFVVYIGKGNQEDANVPAPNTNMFLWLWRRVEEMVSVSHCHFSNLKEKLDTDIEEIYIVPIC